MKIDDPYFDLAEYLRRLSVTERFNTHPRALRQSVAEHAYQVASLVNLICFELNELGHKVDTGKATAFALFHDFGEAFTGDLPYPLKHHTPELNAAIEQAEFQMREVGLHEAVPRYFREGFRECSRDDGSEEWRIVKACDMLDLVLHLLWELEMGNHHFDRMVAYGLAICVRRKDSSKMLQASPMFEYILAGAILIAEQLVDADVFNKHYHGNLGDGYTEGEDAKG
jgi:5'-deoxynucleotidase